MKGKKYCKKWLSLLLMLLLIMTAGMTALADEPQANEPQTEETQTEEVKAESGNVQEETKTEEETAELDKPEEEANTQEETTVSEEVVSVQTQSANEQAEELEVLAAGELSDGVNVIKEGAEGETFNINDGKCVMVEGTGSNPIVFKNCTFNMSGLTMKISGNQGVSYNNGETAAKLFIGKNAQFDNCTFTASNGGKSTAAGWDACIYFFSGEIVLNDCSLKGTGWQGQFLGLYGSNGSVTFNRSKIETVGNTGGWSYAMYGASVLNLNNSTMTATGMEPVGGNINAFYSGDLRTNYDAVNINDSTIDFSDNKAGGFAINNINIHVKNSDITVNNNAGNACNSGYWIVDNSNITMDGNRGGHALSCIGIEMKDSTLEIEHNGYAGMYIQSKDSSFTNCTVDLKCNGEKLKSYSAGDVWINCEKATFTDCKHVWLGGVSATNATTKPRAIINNGCTEFVAYDIKDIKERNPVIGDGVTINAQEKHTLFLNPDLSYDYARRVTEANHDDDIFAGVEKDSVIGKNTAKIGKLTTAQLSHHIYDWTKGTITDNATADNYGVVKYECTDTCAVHKDWVGAHANSFDCAGTYVYAPLVGLTFDDNVDDDSVSGMPDAQTQINYEGSAAKPETNPTRVHSDEGYTWEFTGWYADPECTVPYDFSNKLTDNWTVVYAGWKEVKKEEPEEPVIDDTEPQNPGTSDSQTPKKTTSNKKVSNSVKTGDSANVILWMLILAGAGCVVVGQRIYIRKKH